MPEVASAHTTSLSIRRPAAFRRLFRRVTVVVANNVDAQEFQRLRAAQHIATVRAKRWAEEEYLTRRENTQLQTMGLTLPDSVLYGIRYQAQSAYDAYDHTRAALLQFALRLDIQECSEFFL